MLNCWLVGLILGAIFDVDNEEAEIAFRYAVIRENMYGSKINFVPSIKIVDATDTYEAEQAGKCSNFIFILLILQY